MPHRSAQQPLPVAVMDLARRLWPEVSQQSEVRERLRICEALRVLAPIDDVDWLIPWNGPPKESVLAELGYFCDADLARLAQELCRWQPTVRDAVRWLRAFRRGLPDAREDQLVGQLVAKVVDYARWHNGLDTAAIERVLHNVMTRLDTEFEHANEDWPATDA